MTATLPPEVRNVFDRFITTEYTTVDAKGQPITWPVTPYHRPQRGTVDVTTGIGYPKKARDAQRNPRVALLFSDPIGSGIDGPPAVLVQGTAEVDDVNLDANRRRYREESARKLPTAADKLYPPEFVQKLLDWYFVRLYVYVRPERVYVWPEGDFSHEPQLLDSHIEEVRSHHSEEPVVGHAAADTGAVSWDDRVHELGDRYLTGVLSTVGPDGFPVAARVPIGVDHQRRLIRLSEVPSALPFERGRACLTVHDHNEDFTWQRNFQVRGNLIERDGAWVLEPHKLVGGFELPPGRIDQVKANLRKVMRFRKVAKRELARGPLSKGARTAA